MSANEPSNSIPPADAQFIFECLRNFDDDRQVNLGQVASALGYSNVASVGNRLRAVRKTYGFENLMGKNTAMGAKTSQPAAAATKVQNGDGQKPKRGRPARAKNIKPDGTSPTSSAEVAPRVEVSSKTTNGDEETKPSKRKREDNNDEIKDEKTKTTEQQQQQPKKRGRKPAALAAPTSATTSASSATMPRPASVPASAFTGPMNGSGKANPNTVHFNHIGEPSKRRKKQEDTNSTPSKRIYYTAAETIREARRQRRGRRGSLESGLKLVFKVARSWW